MSPPTRSSDPPASTLRSARARQHVRPAGLHAPPALPHPSVDGGHASRRGHDPAFGHTSACERVEWPTPTEGGVMWTRTLIGLVTAGLLTTPAAAQEPPWGL